MKEDGDEEDMSDTVKKHSFTLWDALEDTLEEAPREALVILGKCRRAARRAGWPKKKIDEVMKEMQAGDYDHLLQTAMKHFNVT